MLIVYAVGNIYFMAVKIFSSYYFVLRDSDVVLVSLVLVQA